MFTWWTCSIVLYIVTRGTWCCKSLQTHLRTSLFLCRIDSGGGGGGLAIGCNLSLWPHGLNFFAVRLVITAVLIGPTLNPKCQRGHHSLPMAMISLSLSPVPRSVIIHQRVPCMWKAKSGSSGKTTRCRPSSVANTRRFYRMAQLIFFSAVPVIIIRGTNQSPQFTMSLLESSGLIL